MMNRLPLSSWTPLRRQPVLPPVANRREGFRSRPPLPPPPSQVQPHHPTLTKFSFPLYPFPTFLIPILPLCTALSSLGFNTFPTEPDDQIPLHTQLRFLGKALPLPPKITLLELAHTYYESVDVSGVTEFLRTPALAKVDRVHFPRRTLDRVREVEANWELLDECEMRGIAVVGVEELRCGHS